MPQNTNTTFLTVPASVDSIKANGVEYLKSPDGTIEMPDALANVLSRGIYIAHSETGNVSDSGGE